MSQTVFGGRLDNGAISQLARRIQRVGLYPTE